MKEKQLVKSIKLTVNYIRKENKIEEKDFFKILNDIRYNSYLAYNKALTYLYTNDMQNLIQKDVGIPKQNEREVFGKSFGAWIEEQMKKTIVDFNTMNVAQARQMVCLRYKNDKIKLLKGEVSLSQFKRETAPVVIHNENYNIIETPKGLGVEVSFFNQGKLKELGMKRGEKVRFLFPNINKGEKEIIRRLLEGTYKNGSAQFVYNKKKKKWEFALSYKFTKTCEDTLNSNLIMGVDLGITNVATFSILDTTNNTYKKMRYSDCCIDGTELIHFRNRIEARRRSIYQSCKWSSDNNTGRGYKARTSKANAIGDKIAKFRDTYNHKVSRYIVDMALKNSVGCIQMEELSGFSEKQTEKFLKDWAYFDLQNKISYKANEVGIEVVKINPKYTSKRCNKCGCIDEKNRNCKNDQANFKCVTCGHSDNADINASKNISIPNIEAIIKNKYLDLM